MTNEVDTSPPEASPLRLVLSVEAAADALSISRTRMFALIKSGAIRSVRIGRLRRIPAEAVNEYVDQLLRTHAPTSHESQI